MRSHQGRVLGLDGLRGVAIVLVLIGHFATSTFPGTPTAGVCLFFGLSGFLITRLLLAERAAAGANDLPAFYVRRARRLLPPLVVMLAVVAAVELWDGVPHRWIVHDSAVSIFYVANWFPATRNGWASPLGHMWSLGVEEQFYLLWPLLLPLVVRLRRPAVLLAVAAAVGLAWRVVLWRAGYSFNRWYAGTDTVAGGLLVGCAVAFLPRPPRVRATVAAACVAVIVLVGAAGPWWSDTDTAPARCLMFVLAAVLVVPLLFAAMSDGGWLTNPVLRWLGVISYSLYLWHLPVLWYFRSHHTPYSPRVEEWMALLLSVALAAASRRWVEEPFLRRGRRTALGVTP